MNADANEGGGVGGVMVMGLGNVLRGDDGVGVGVVEALGADVPACVCVEACGQLTPEMALRVARVRAVVFVDALVVEEAFEGVWGRLVVREIGVGAGWGDGSGAGWGWTPHRVEPWTLLALAKELTGRVPRAWVVGIPVEAGRFGWGIGLSEGARAGVEAAVGWVRRWLAGRGWEVKGWEGGGHA